MAACRRPSQGAKKLGELKEALTGRNKEAKSLKKKDARLEKNNNNKSEHMQKLLVQTTETRTTGCGNRYLNQKRFHIYMYIWISGFMQWHSIIMWVIPREPVISPRLYIYHNHNWSPPFSKPYYYYTEQAGERQGPVAFL